MNFCSTCGGKLEAGAKFCPHCGAAVYTSNEQTDGTNEAPTHSDYDALADADRNKGMAAVAYILFFIPLITGDHQKSPFVKFHTNQALILWISAAVLGMLKIIVIPMIAVISTLMLPVGIFAGLFGLLSFAASIAIFVLFIIGIVNAVSGKMQPLPLVGDKFTILK